MWVLVIPTEDVVECFVVDFSNQGDAGLVISVEDLGVAAVGQEELAESGVEGQHGEMKGGPYAAQLGAVDQRLCLEEERHDLVAGQQASPVQGGSPRDRVLLLDAQHRLLLQQHQYLGHVQVADGMGEMEGLGRRWLEIGAHKVGKGRPSCPAVLKDPWKEAWRRRGG